MSDRARTALITGGTGGLGTAVVRTFLDRGWRVVVPWILQRELERLGEAEGLEMVQADLVEPDDVARAARAAIGEQAAPLRAVVNLVGGFAAGQRVAEAPLS